MYLNFNHSLTLFSASSSFSSSLTHPSDVKGDGGSAGQPADSEVDVGLGPRQDEEMGHSERAGHIHEIHQHIPLSHLATQHSNSDP